MLVRDRPPRTLVAVRARFVVPIARCQFRGCPFRWPADTRRQVCADHDSDSALRTAAESLGIDWTETMAAAPGDRDGQR